MSGNVHRKWLTIACGLGISTLTGCSGSDSTLQAENAQLKRQISQLQTENEQLKAKKSETVAPLANQAAQPVAAATAQPSGTALDTAHPAMPADVSGLDGAQDIKNVIGLGIIELDHGLFAPSRSVTRAEYIRWLVQANNIYAKDPKSRIRLADSGDATFVDVPPSNPDFKFVQGLANAGYVVGVDKSHFAPAQPITREQMICIKAQVDEGAAIEKEPNIKNFISFSDVAQIDPAYADAVHEDQSARTTNNISRIWGSIKTLHPQKQLTREEAAISLAKIRDGAAPAIN